ncbi:hypothetical protein [Chryseobacterium sp. Marseille-Q3244]|uniref:hypothetical protein n=1 Tax=Chryseobacterium sp. Marseille-Q3244 TaxID=2758092 RepID=UPI002024CC77|nr:hypothetical protein [Chryseobacterium sp. Marseille-Q3244]
MLNFLKPQHTITMTINEIKEAAIACKTLNQQELSDKIKELKDNEVSFLGCFAFTQHNQQISLSESIEMTLKLDVFTEEEKTQINGYLNLAWEDFKEDEN